MLAYPGCLVATRDERFNIDGVCATYLGQSIVGCPGAVPEILRLAGDLGDI